MTYGKRVQTEVQRLGEDRVRVRWTKGHATPEDIEQGKSTERDAQRNEEADNLVQAGMQGWAIPKWQCDLYFQTRRVAILTHRMYIAVLQARMKSKMEREMQEVAMRMDGGDVRMGMETQQGMMMEMRAQQPETQGWTEEENEEWIKGRYPGYKWNQGIGDEGRRYPLTEEIPSREWKYLPQSFLEPLVWFWDTANWATGVAHQGRMRGTTWLQLAADFEALTGKESSPTNLD